MGDRTAGALPLALSSKDSEPRWGGAKGEGEGKFAKNKGIPHVHEDSLYKVPVKGKTKAQ